MDKLRVQIELTTRCTTSCSFCPRYLLNKRKKPRDITPKKHDLFIKRILEHENLKVSLSGFGEPLCYSRIIEFLEPLNEAEIFTEINSNGEDLAGPRAEGLINLVNELQISLCLPTRELYKKHRNEDLYDKVKENVINFLDLKGEQKPRVDLRFLSFPETAPFLLESIREWAPIIRKGGYGIRVVYFENWMGLIDEKKYGIEYRPISKDVAPVCSDLFDHLTITKEGSAYCCCMAVANPTNHMYLGNIKDNSLQEIYDNPRRKEYIEAHKEKKHPKRCLNCSKLRPRKEENYAGINFLV